MSDNAIYQALQHGLTQAGAVQDPADVHGTLTGMLCVTDEIDVAGALDDDITDALDQALDALREMTLAGLFDPDLSFQLLLPDDEVALATRVDSLARWCAGFLYGLSSQQGDAGEIDFSAFSEDTREVINDLSQLSRVGLTAEDDDIEAGEADFAELVEYARVGVQMIFMAFRPARRGPETRETLH